MSRQWQCTCGKWIDEWQMRHAHVTLRQPNFGEMVAARQVGRDADALTAQADCAYVNWSPDFPRRNKPSE